eukprot:gene5291-18535_t
MEDWLHFVQTFSLYIFLPGTLPEMLATMWKLLQSVVHHCCQGTNFTFRKSGDAAKSLLKYAKMVEENFPSKMCTYNLHMVVCRLPRQEQQRGSAAREMEFVVERCKQGFKARTGRRVCKDPEKVFVGDLLLERALAKIFRELPSMHSFKELCGDPGLRLMQGSNYDELAWEHQQSTQSQYHSRTLLLGKGNSPDQVQRGQIQAALEEALAVQLSAGLTEVCVPPQDDVLSVYGCTYLKDVDDGAEDKGYDVVKLESIKACEYVNANVIPISSNILNADNANP